MFTGGRRPDDLNHNVFASSGLPIMRRILIGLKVVRPRCAAGAPPRPRLRSTAPEHEPERSQTTPIKPLMDPILYGGPQHR
jgi:hypothetical protein